MSGLYRELSTENGFEIRLVVIEGIDTTHNEVSCRLETLQFSQSLQYHALSYTWGDEKNPGSIICNGVRLSVTSNLASALHCLLKRGEKNNIPMSFWIDAICINQDDKSERENQVILMGDIYRQAAEVIVWLGPTADNSALAFDVCRRLCFKEHDKIATTSKEPQKKSWATDSESYTYIFLGGRRKLNKGLHDFIRELDAIQAIRK